MRSIAICTGLLILLIGNSPAIVQVAPNSRYQSILNFGDAAPVGGQTFTTFNSVVMSANGNWIGFDANHSPFGAVDQGFFRYSTATGLVNTIISKNDAVPGGTFNMASGFGRQLSVTNLGTMGFNGTIGGATAGTDTGWYYGSGAGVTEMLREGNTTSSGGTFKNLGTGVLDIQFRGLNDLNQTIFQTQVVG